MASETLTGALRTGLGGPPRIVIARFPFFIGPGALIKSFQRYGFHARRPGILITVPLCLIIDTNVYAVSPLPGPSLRVLTQFSRESDARSRPSGGLLARAFRDQCR